MIWEFSFCSRRKDLLQAAIAAALPGPRLTLVEQVAVAAAALVEAAMAPAGQPEKSAVHVESEGTIDAESGVCQVWLKVEPIDPAGRVLLEEPSCPTPPPPP